MRNVENKTSLWICLILMLDMNLSQYLTQYKVNVEINTSIVLVQQLVTVATEGRLVETHC